MRILTVFGTRSEIIKMAPFVTEEVSEAGATILAETSKDPIVSHSSLLVSD